MKITSCLFLIAIAGVLAAPQPVKDFHSTSVELDQTTPLDNGPVSEGFAVTVTRVDELFSDQDAWLGEKIKSVKLSFDVVGGELQCNGQRVPVGTSNLMVSTLDMTAVVADAKEDVSEEFTGGIASVQFEVAVDELSVDGLNIRRLTIAETIKEVDGVLCVQRHLVQQVIDIFPDGSCSKQPPMFTLPVAAYQDPDEFSLVDEKSVAETLNKDQDNLELFPTIADEEVAATSTPSEDQDEEEQCFVHRVMVQFAKWFHAQSTTVRVLVSASHAMIFCATLIAVYQLMSFLCRLTVVGFVGYRSVEISDVETAEHKRLNKGKLYEEVSAKDGPANKE